jgi:hypothetical protein
LIYVEVINPQTSQWCKGSARKFVGSIPMIAEIGDAGAASNGGRFEVYPAYEVTY